MNSSFTLSTNKSDIKLNIQRSLFLADKNAFNYDKDLSELRHYNRIIPVNINQTVQVESLVCNFDRYLNQVATFAKLMIVSERSVTERSLITRC